jgi:hypothetical protein
LGRGMAGAPGVKREQREMRGVTRRIARLERDFGTVDGRPRIRLIVGRADREPALDQDRCIEILDECGHLPTGPEICLVVLGNIPEGLSAAETERYLREHGADLCGGRRPLASGTTSDKTAYR